MYKGSPPLALLGAIKSEDSQWKILVIPEFLALHLAGYSLRIRQENHWCKLRTTSSIMLRRKLIEAKAYLNLFYRQQMIILRFQHLLIICFSNLYQPRDSWTIHWTVEAYLRFELLRLALWFPSTASRCWCLCLQCNSIRHKLTQNWRYYTTEK